jgi:exopolysaccharide biosynthesis polyprenyl glycosylphosphotransferase
MATQSTLQQNPPAQQRRQRLLGTAVERTPLRGGERAFLFDTAMLMVALAADYAAARAADLPIQEWYWLLLPAPLTLLLLGAWGVYRPRMTSSFLEDARGVIAATAVAAMLVTFLRVLTTDDPTAASQAVRFWLFAGTYLLAARAGVRLSEVRAAARGAFGRPTLIVGAGQIGHLLANRLIADQSIDLVPVGFVDDDPRDIEDFADVPVLGSLDELEALVAEYKVEHAILSFSRASHQQDLETKNRLLNQGVSLSIIPRLFEGVPDRIALERVGGLPLVTIYPSDPKSVQFSIKYVIERILALGIVLLLSPLLLVLIVLVAIDLGRPVFFRQTRVGLDGSEFDMLKFRSMRDPEEDPDPATPASPLPEVDSAGLEAGVAPGGVEGADRRTRLGRFLRRTSLDELPQLLNVVSGDMSLVGPRPERPGFVRLYTPEVYRYADRHRVRSGITGWAQIHGLRGKTSLADRVEWDNYYIENWSLWLDVKILLRTLPAVLRHRAE